MVYAREKLFEDGSNAVMIRPREGRPSLVEFAAGRAEDIGSQLLHHGAILFRGFAVDAVADFDRFVDRLSDRHIEYVYRSTPRTEVSERVYTATAYPKGLEIPLHNENAYQLSWPLSLAFYCMVAAAEGGETPVASMEVVTSRLSGALMDRLQRCGVQYIRHYHANVDLPWQTVFQTSDREVLEAYCREHGIECSWLSDGTLRTSQICQGVANHPLSRHRIFFNQAHLFHVSSLGNAAAAMIDMFGMERLPRHARYGDGSEISEADLCEIRDAFKASELVFRWQAGDVLLLDNMQYAHGRRPFKGERQVFAALMNDVLAVDPQADATPSSRPVAPAA
jgi:alpha-ketoglutarate-dependent taurine dioxygenase